jgi:hypothetical protein
VIRAFDRVCEVQSDKATVEITSRFGGVVAKVYSAEGDVVKVSRLTASTTRIWIMQLTHLALSLLLPCRSAAP